MRVAFSRGDCNVKRIYANFSNPRVSLWRHNAASLNLEVRDNANNARGKNASDISLTADATELLLSGNYDGFVIVSSDSDYTTLVDRIQNRGKFVIGIGCRHTPASHSRTCDEFINVENLAFTI